MIGSLARQSVGEDDGGQAMLELSIVQIIVCVSLDLESYIQGRRIERQVLIAPEPLLDFLQRLEASCAEIQHQRLL